MEDAGDDIQQTLRSDTGETVSTFWRKQLLFRLSGAHSENRNHIVINILAKMSSKNHKKAKEWQELLFWTIVKISQSTKFDSLETGFTHEQLLKSCLT